MAIPTLCPNCQGVFRLPDDLAGRTVQCRNCEYQFTVPAANSGAGNDSTIPVAQQIPQAQEKEPDKSKLAPGAFEDAETRRRRTPPSPFQGNERPDDEPEPSLAEKPVASKTPGSRWKARALSAGLLIGGVVGCWILISSGGNRQPDELVRPLPPAVKAPAGKPVPGRPFDHMIRVQFDAKGRYADSNRIDTSDPIMNQPGDPPRQGKCYSARLERGTTYQFDLRSGDVDAFLCLCDFNGKLVDENDSIADHASDSRIRWTAAYSGEHRLFATSLNGDEAGAYTIEIRRDDGLDVAKLPPKGDPNQTSAPKNASVASPPIRTATAIIRQLNLPDWTSAAALPVWSSDGESLFYASSRGKLHRIRARDFVVETTRSLIRNTSGLALSSEGLVETASGSPCVHLIDPTTLEVIYSVGSPSFQHIAAVPSSHLAVAYQSEFGGVTLVDLKARKLCDRGKLHTWPKNLTSHRSLAFGLDGRFFFLQGADQLHRFRIEDRQVVFEESSPLVGKSVHQFVFSPDGKIMGCCSPVVSKIPTAEQVAFFHAPTWNAAPIRLPFPTRAMAFLGDGGMVVQKNEDCSLHLLQPPFGAGASVNLGWTQGRVRSIAAQPRGAGFLVVASNTGSPVNQQVYYVELKK